MHASKSRGGFSGQCAEKPASSSGQAASEKKEYVWLAGAVDRAIAEYEEGARAAEYGTATGSARASFGVAGRSITSLGGMQRRG